METTENESTTESEKPNEVESTDDCRNCGRACDAYENPALRCSGGCDQNIHIRCLRRGGVPVSFVGDVFFELHCASCNSGDELIIRDKMPWLTAIILAMYNLREKSSGISNKGYFHWKSDISSFVDRNWDHLFKKTVKKKKNWIGTISGTLSHYNGVFFKSGINELGEPGWWKLVHKDPPEVLIAKNRKMLMEKKQTAGTKVARPLNSPIPSDSSVSVEEDSNCGTELFKNESLPMYSHAYVRPTETLSDFLLQEDEPNDLDIEDDLMLCDNNDVPSISDMIRDCQYEGNNFHLTQLMDNYEWLCNTSSMSPTDIDNEIKKSKEETYDEEDSSNSSAFTEEQPVVSLFNETKRRQWPWSKTFAPIEKLPHMTPQEEAYLLQKISKTDLGKAPFAVRRLYRKLGLRKTKREYGLPLLDIDQTGYKAGTSVIPSKTDGRVLDRFFSDELEYMFEQRLQGYNEPISVHSPYTDRLLKPFIRRDTSYQPLWLTIMEELCRRVNKDNPQWKASPRAPIDYSYIKPQHVPAINSLCRQFFWPGIDLTECLQYPDFTCVVLYKKLVIGFAMLVPDVGYNEAYISFFLVRPEWRKCGIGTFMLYHLIQTCMAQDITLHVSATNVALILYQKFGFKVEEFIQDFYDKYMPPNSRECRHALFLRLSR